MKLAEKTVLSNGIAVIKGDTHISKWVADTGRLDHDKSMLPKVLPYIKGGTVVDGGAFIGDHTIAYARKAKAVYAFEPNSVAYDCLKHNMAKHPNVKCFNMALGEKRGRATLVNQPNAGAAFLEEGGDIRIMALDELRLENVTFIKLDIEGWELHALRGAEMTITNNRPVMLLEINVHALARQKVTPKDIYDFLSKHNYTYSNVYPTERMGGVQFDLICLPKQ